MHVSLHRRSHRVGTSLQYLLWICFGILAFLPWQIIRGQEAPDQTVVETAADTPAEITAKTDQDPSDPAFMGQTLQSARFKRVTAQYGQANSTPSMYRGQSDMPGSMPMGSGPVGTAPMGSRPVGDGDPIPFGGFMDDQRLTGRSGQAFGAQYRASFLTGPAIGRQHNIIPLEVMPYAFMDNAVFFADIRGFASTNPAGGGYGGNFGGGARLYMPRFDRILGVNAYFDYDNSSGALFREVGFGAELLGALWDMRANAYLPFGPSSQLLSINNINGTQVFAGHSLLVDQLKTVANALRGFDAEVGVPLPGRVAMKHDFRIFGGGYYFQGDQIQTFGGWKMRAQGNVTPNILLSLQISNDPQFKTNVVFAATWSFGGFTLEDDQPKTQYGRMTTPVIRQYNMVVGDTSQVLRAQTVINPATNTPYFFEHVSNNTLNPVAGIHDGTVEHPFLNLTDAQAVATANDIIFVHGNSVYGTTAMYPGQQVTLQPNVLVLGESTNVEHAVATSAGTLLLPHPTPQPAAMPIFANSPGDGVLLASNSAFSGFQILNPANYGIEGDPGVANVTLRQDVVSGSGNSSVFLNGTSGTITMQGDTINDPATNATTFVVQNTTGVVNFTFDNLSDLRSAAGALIPTPGVINNVVGTGGMALLVQNTAAGSIVNFTGSTTNDTTGNGILFQTNAGVVELGDANVTNGLAVGLDILNNPGTIIGNGDITVTNSTGDSILIQGNTGSVFFSNPGTAGTGAAAGINVANRQSTGIHILSNPGNITFLTPISVAAAGPIAFSAIDYQNNSGATAFDAAITLNGGTNGITIGNAAGIPAANTGSFTVNATTKISNMTGTSIFVTNDQSTVSFSGGVANSVQINNRGGMGINVLNNRGTTVFGGTTTVNNQNNSNAVAVNIQGNNVGAGANPTVTFNTLSIEQAAGPAATGVGAIGLNIGGTTAPTANSASVTINNLNIGDVTVATGGTALSVHQEGTNVGNALSGLTIGNGTINVTGGPAIDIQNSTMRVNLASVSSTNSPTNGITLINDQSFTPLPNNVTAPQLADYMFTILGNPATVVRNGGTITGAANDGIFINQTAANLIQTGDVSLNQVNVVSNFNNIVATNLLQLTMTNSNIATATHQGLLGTNIPLVNINTSYFNANGTTVNDHGVHLTANTTLLTTNRTAGQYEWNLENNNTNSAGIIAGFTGVANSGNVVQVDSGGTTLKVQLSPTITQVTPLVFNFLNNTVLMAPGPAPAAGVVQPQIAAVAVDWTGFESGSINQNTLTLRGFNEGIVINNTDTFYLTNFFILGNTITGNGGGNFGLFVNNQGPTDLTIGTLLINGQNIQQTFTFNTPAGVAGGANTADNAINISVLNGATPATSSLISLTDNLITMTGAAQDQGIVFPLLEGATPGPTTVNLSNNTININTAPNGPFIGTGIDFQSILGTVGLQGSLSNSVTVNGANTIPNAAGVTLQDWVFIQGATTGSFLVNGLRIF